MNNIAVVCAYNPRNAGMYSVDLAARSFLVEGLGLDVDMLIAQWPVNRLTCLLPPGLIPTKRVTFGRLEYRKLIQPSQLENYDLIIYWGDFLTNPYYGVRDFARRDVGQCRSRTVAEGFERWAKLFLPETEGHGPRRLSIGTSFLNCQPHQTLREFGPATLNRYRHFARVITRDPISHSNISRLAGPDAHVKPGVDCAFLLPSPFGREKVEQPLDEFCFHFGRSHLAGTDDLLDRLQRRTGLRGSCLDQWFKLDPARADSEFMQMRRQIARSRFVLTDTYHVAVNAIAMGVPVFVLSRTVDVQKGTLGDFKKKVLMQMFGLESRLFECEEGIITSSRIEKILNSICDGGEELPKGHRERRKTLTKQLASDIQEAVFHDG